MARRRKFTEKETNAGMILGTVNIRKGIHTIDRSRVDFSVVENIDINRLLVFNPQGKVIAETTLSSFCEDIYVYGNRIFIIDGYLNQRILEYEMNFDGI